MENKFRIDQRTNSNMLNNRKNVSRFIMYVLIAFFIVPKNSGAQHKDPDKNVYNRSYDNIRAYKPKLTDAIKLNIIPINEQLKIRKPIMDYSFKPKLFETPKNEKKIPAVSLVNNRRKKFKKSFVKIGGGNYSNLLAEIDFNTTKYKDKLFTAHLKHHSGIASDSLKNSNFSEQFVNLSGSKFYKSSTLSSSVFFSNNIIHYYGEDFDSFEFKKDDIKQRFLEFGLNASFDNELDKKSEIKYGIVAGFYNLSDLFNSSELGITLDGYIKQDFNGNPVNIGIGYKFCNYDTNNNFFNSILRIKPSYTLFTGVGDFDLGFFLVSENTSSLNKFHFYPNVSFTSDPIGDHVSIFAGVTGDMMENSFRDFSKGNPFIQSNLNIVNTNNKFELYGGLKGNIIKNLDYTVSLAFQNLNNLSYYLNDTLDMKKFFILYDSSNVTLIKFNGEIMATMIKDLALFLGFNFYKYESSQEAEAWHRPIFDIKFTGKYNIDKKIYVNIDAFIIGDIKALDLRTNTTIDLGAIYDINAGLTYRFSKLFSVFFQFNNLVGGKYTAWYNYQVRGFHVLGGATLNF